MTTANLVKKFNSLEGEMNGKYLNRRGEIHGLFVTLLARGNMILLGKPGTAKTDMVMTLAKQINGRYFETLLTRTSAPEELWGVYSLKDLENGVFRRITDNTLADAHVGFVDETFKCNSAVLNGLLGAMAMRTFRNGTAAPSPIPLQMLVGASNEMPEGGAEGELGALWDRFEMRFITDYLSDENNFTALLALAAANDPTTVIDMAEVEAAQKETEAVKVDPLMANLVNLWKSLRKEGYIVSDRKWRNCLKYLRANAWLDGRTECSEDDLEVLTHMFWQEESQIKPLRKIILAFANPLTVRANEIWDSSVEEFARIRSMPEDNAKERSLAATELNAKLTKAKRSLANMINEAIDTGKSSTKLKERLAQVEELNATLVKEILLNM